VEEAAGWLEYCNLETDTEYANLRRSNGHAAPHNVRIWELDNEVWVIYPQNERGAADYADRAFHFATILKRIDPSIQLIACGLGKPEWDRPVLERLAGLIDYLAVHHYVGKGDEYQDLLGSSREIETKIQSTLETIDAVVKEKGISRPIAVAFNEYNIVRDWSSGRGPSDHRFELSFNLRDALWLAQTLNAFQRLSPQVGIANYSELVNVVATVMTRSDGMFRQPPYFTLQLYSRHCGPQRLDCQAICPTFSTRQHSRIPYLEVSATKDETGRLALIVANLHESQSAIVRNACTDCRRRATQRPCSGQRAEWAQPGCGELLRVAGCGRAARSGRYHHCFGIRLPLSRPLADADRNGGLKLRRVGSRFRQMPGVVCIE
jgi:alpha-N-arabinofuranosidase